MDPLNYETVAPKNVVEAVKKLMIENGADTLVGSMMATRGIFILLFSHRLNRDFGLYISSSELAPVLSKVYETLAGSS
jgi:hypothetical protein